MTVQTISMEQLDRLGVDESGRLFWDGKEVLTVLSLRWYVEAAIIVGAAAGIIAAIWPIARFFLAGS